MKYFFNKSIKLFINILFVFVWFLFTLYIWSLIAEWLEYEDIFLHSLWVERFAFIYFPNSFWLIFLIPVYLFTKYIWFRKRFGKQLISISSDKKRILYIFIFDLFINLRIINQPNEFQSYLKIYKSSPIPRPQRF